MKEILLQEFIGNHVKIVDAKNTTLKGVEGVIVDETKHTFVVQVAEEQVLKRILKHVIVLELSYKGKRVRIQGRLLVGRPEDRIKKKRNRK